MIKRQYYRFDPGYFYNFINGNELEGSIKQGLAPYKATIAKSKHPTSKMNVKWHDHKLYMLFVMRWS